MNLGDHAMAWILLATLLTICCIVIEGEEIPVTPKNLLNNPSFEEPLKKTWSGNGVTMEQYFEDHTHGEASLIIKNRKRYISGLAQTLPQLTPGRGYELRADIKLLNANPKKLFQSFKAIVVFQFTHEDDKKRGGEDKSGSGLSGKPPTCKNLKGQERKGCLARRRLWREEMKKQKEKKQREKEARKRAKEERKKKKMEAKKKKADQKKKQKDRENAKKEKQEGRGKSKKEKQKAREEKQKERERQRKERERQREEREREKLKRNGGRRGKREANENMEENAVLELPSSRLRHMTSHMTAAEERSRRQVSRLLSRQRRQQRRRRVDPPTTILRHGKILAPTDDQEVKPASGAPQREGVYIIAWRAWVTPEQGWITLVGSINAPMLAFTRSSLRIRGPDAMCNFLIDNVTFYEIPERADWLAQSHVMIDRHRKSDVTFRVEIPPNISRAEVDIQVRLQKHLFAFGSKVEDKLMFESHKHHKFRELFFTLFNWATIGSFKWRFDKGPTLFSPDFSNALAALEVLRQRGVKVRAHSILWGVKKNVPDAVIATPPDQLPELISFHIQHMMNITRGKVEHWDVQNELLHGHWYEETLKDPDISLKVFREARRLDPYPKLYLNDFTAVTSGANTEDFHDTAIHFMKAGTGIQGLGIQGHTKEFVKPDPTMMWRRLDRLAETGLELFMTEFDIGWSDDAVRADWLEDAMRAFFAHPGLSGVILWGFWKDIQRYKNKYLVYGEDLKMAEPGKRFVCLIKKEWRTDATFNMAFRSGFTVRGFQGDYEVIVRRGGVPIQRQTFSLGKENKAVDVRVTESLDPIELMEEKDYAPECISHRDRKSLGVLYTTSSDPQLTCVNQPAAQLSPNSSHVKVTCPEGSIMIGCSSFQEGRSSMSWRGEGITLENGIATCAAIIPPYGKGGMRVTARCCQRAGLTCDYRQAGPSSPMPGAMAEAKCPLGYTAAGCTVLSDYSHIRGVFTANNMTSCRAVNGLPSSVRPEHQSGVVSGAVCCKSRGLRCHTIESVPSEPGDHDVTVTCPQGDVMTGCHVRAVEGGAAGSYFSSNSQGRTSCTAHPERNARVVAVAICCAP